MCEYPREEGGVIAPPPLDIFGLMLTGTFTGEEPEESETGSPFIFITERRPALTLPVLPPSLCHTPQPAGKNRPTNQRTDSTSSVYTKAKRHDLPSLSGRELEPAGFQIVSSSF